MNAESADKVSDEIRGFVEQGRELIQHFDLDDIQEGVRLLRKAYDAGFTQAGWDLAFLPGGRSQSLAGLSDSERIFLLRDAALNGSVSAALNLYYVFGDQLSAAAIRNIMSKVSEYSSEAREIFRKQV